MKKIPILIYSFGLVLLAFAVPSIALAQVVITEIMYDPPGTDSGHEWIEVYNAGDSSIPLTTWKLYEGDANHNIIAASGEKLLTSKSFAVIAESAAKFESDYPDYSGELFHSAFSLDNAGATIELRNASSTVIASASYDSSQGALGDGNSLQRPPDDNAQFSPHVPTPGVAMSSDVVPAKVKFIPAKKTTTKQSNTKAAKSAQQISPPDSETAHADQVVIHSSQIAAVAAGDTNDTYWWLAAAALAVVATLAIAASKHFKKTEWNIVEENLEDV